MEWPEDAGMSSSLCQTSPKKSPLHKLATYLSSDPCSERGWTLSILNLPGTPQHRSKLTFLPLKSAGLNDCCLSPWFYSCLFLHFLQVFSWRCRSCPVLLTSVLCVMWKLFKNPKCFLQCILGGWCVVKQNNTNLQNLLHGTNVFESVSVRVDFVTSKALSRSAPQTAAVVTHSRPLLILISIWTYFFIMHSSVGRRRRALPLLARWSSDCM